MLSFPAYFKNLVFAKSQFHRHVWWNAFSFAVMGVSGIALNILLLAKYGAQTLGAFNQVYAVYILASQLAAFGLPSSVLKYIAEHSENHSRCNEILGSALLLVLGIAGCVCLIYYFSASGVGKLLDSEAVRKGMILSVCGLWFFAVNKILLAFLNGRQFMKAFALFNSYRYFALPAFLIVFIVIGLPGHISPLVFTLTEATLFIALLAFVFRFWSITLPGKKWLKAHLLFGGKSLAGGTAAEMNTRVDVLMLGFFYSDKVVGIYSFAAMLAEGIDLIPIIFRVNYNPLLTKQVIAGRLEELCSLIKSFVKRWRPIALAIGAAAVLAFPLLVKIITNDPELSKGWIVFAILAVGIVFRSGYYVFWELPVQSGHPGWQTTLILLVVIGNILLNFLLIPRWGIYGAATATTTTFVLSVVWLKIVVKKTLGISI